MGELKRANMKCSTDISAISKLLSPARDGAGKCSQDTHKQQTYPSYTPRQLRLSAMSREPTIFRESHRFFTSKPADRSQNPKTGKRIAVSTQARRGGIVRCTLRGGRRWANGIDGYRSQNLNKINRSKNFKDLAVEKTKSTATLRSRGFNFILKCN